MDKKNAAATLQAILAAAFYALNMPASKALLGSVDPTAMAALLYLGAGIGVGALYLLGRGRQDGSEPLGRADLPYVVGMIVLDVLAPICLMMGLSRTTAANASLLNNFEIVATSLIALLIFGEAISGRLWGAIALITLSSAMLSFEDASSLRFSWGSALVLLAALCWGLENNCTRKISEKNTYQIVTLKGIFSGLGALAVAALAGERLPDMKLCAVALALGFVAYGLSIFCYIKAQRVLGAAKTSAYYAVAPFVGAFLSFVFLREPLTVRYLEALAVMLAGSALVARDTLRTEN